MSDFAQTSSKAHVKFEVEKHPWRVRQARLNDDRTVKIMPLQTCRHLARSLDCTSTADTRGVFQNLRPSISENDDISARIYFIEQKIISGEFLVPPEREPRFYHHPRHRLAYTTGSKRMQPIDWTLATDMASSRRESACCVRSAGSLLCP